MTRILHVASGREWRGGQRQTWLLARELQRAGVEQLLITRSDSELARRAAADGVPVRGVSWDLGIDPRAWWAVRTEARRAPAILHAHDGHAVTIARWASDAATPWIATRRNSTPLRTPSGWRSAARVVAISQAVREQLIADGLAPEQVAVVPSGIDLAATTAAPSEDLRAWASLPEGGTVVFTIAALTPEKGLETVVAACRELTTARDLRWVVAGEGPLRSRLEALAAQAGVGDRLRFPGHHPDPIRLLRSADLFVSASRSEGLGTSILDAMALGVPIAATAAGGVVELLREGAGLLVPVDDPGALAAAVRRLTDDKVLRTRTLTAAARTIQRFDLATMAAGMRCVYDSVVANR